MGTTPNLVRPFIQANTVDGGTVQQDGQIVGLNDGGYVIIYNDQSPTFTSGQAIVGQRFDAAGNKVGSELRVGAFDDGQDSVAGGSSITKLPNGNIAFAYTDVFNGHSDVWVRVLTPALGVVRDDAIDTGSAQTKNASITSFADGSYAVSYTLDNGGGNTDILARIVSATGAVGAPITVRDNGTLGADLSQLATLSNNTFVDVYQRVVGSDHDISFAIYTASGAPVVSFQQVVGGSSVIEEVDPDVAALAGGGFVVGWTDAQGDGDGPGLRMSIYDNAGQLVAGDIQINTTFELIQHKLSLAALQDGGFVATWEDDGLQSFERGQRFDATGHQIGGEFVVKEFGGSVNRPVDSLDTALLSSGRFAYALGDHTAGDNDVTTSIWDPRTLRDFDANGTSDVLWRDDATGHVGVWSMQNGVPIAHDLGGSGVDHKVVGIGDFNGDGTSDIFWRNDSTGHVGWWEMHNNSSTWHDLGTISGVDHKVVGVGDFNGDGTADIFWRNDVTGHVGWWEMHGGNPTWHDLGTTSGVDHKVVGVGDFNGDGTSDIFWRNDSTGHVGWWEMHNGNPTWHDLGNSSGIDHKVVGVGDFNGDGTSDIFWRNDSTGHVGWWEMHNGTPTWHDLGNSSGIDHKVAEIGDFNGDGTSDIFWRNDATGHVGWWEMHNGAPTWHDLGYTSSPADHVVMA